jgi:hypothetical protein
MMPEGAMLVPVPPGLFASIELSTVLLSWHYRNALGLLLPTLCTMAIDLSSVLAMAID